MKTLYTLVVTLIFQFAFSQVTNVIYEYQHIPDSTNREHIVKELMVLSLTNGNSEFYNLAAFKNDSLTSRNITQGLPPPPQSFVNNNSRVIKDSQKNIRFISTVGSSIYEVSQKINFNWILQPEYEKIMNYKVQKATTNYGGRSWTAWFTTEIPIQDGPYKFCNLPGLILKIEDSGKNHIFEITGIRKSSENFEYPKNKYVQFKKIDYSTYVKIFKNFRENPLADLINKIEDSQNSNGSVIPKAQIIKELQEQEFKNLAKDNNLIEIDLLK